MTSETYGLGEFRDEQLAAPRVRDDDVVVDTGDNAAPLRRLGEVPHLVAGRPGRRARSSPRRCRCTSWSCRRTAPTTATATRTRPRSTSSRARGYEIHDDQRYDWKQGDLVFVHTDSVHRHFNPYDEKAVALVMKAKCTWMFMGLIQQGRSGPIAAAGRVRRPRGLVADLDRRACWTARRSSPPRTRRWETTPLGRMRRDEQRRSRTDHRQFGVDVFELTIPAGSRSGKHWKMADEILYVLDGEGYSLHWEVQAEIAEKYYARIAKEPTRHEISKGDTLYVPQNTVVAALRRRRHAAAPAVRAEPGLQAPRLRQRPLLRERPEYDVSSGRRGERADPTGRWPGTRCPCPPGPPRTAGPARRAGPGRRR